jgi:DNA repair protein RadC
MRELTPGDRPREKLERAGSQGLGDNELLAVVLGHGRRHRDALALANELLGRAGGLHALLHLHRRQLMAVPGIGEVQASRVQAALELGRRTLLVRRPARPCFRTPREAALYLMPEYASHPVERVGVLMLDAKCRLVGTRLISVGLLDASLAHPREVFREALLVAASGIIVFHNHPSGDPSPSADDLALTHRLRSAGLIMGIDLVDHLILADQKYYSMKEAGRLG